MRPNKSACGPQLLKRDLQPSKLQASTKATATARLRTLIDNLRKRSQTPTDHQSKLGMTSSAMSRTHAIDDADDRSFRKLVSDVTTSQQATGQSTGMPDLDDLRQEKSKLQDEHKKLEEVLRRTRVERMLWKEKVIELEKRIDARLRQQIEERESRSLSREKPYKNSKNSSVLFLRASPSPKGAQNVFFNDISFS